MGSMLKFDSERRELVDARIERKQQRRQARERKRSHTGAMPSATQRVAQEQVEAAVDRIVGKPLDRYEQTADAPLTPASAVRSERPCSGEDARAVAAIGSVVPASRSPRLARREREIAEFRERRQRAADEARREARRRIARAGELASVADAFAAVAHPAADPWGSEREQLERALESGRILEVGTAARRALWAITRDAARSSRRANRDPELAVAACVAYAIIARLPRTTLRSARRAHPTPRAGHSQRAFWR